ANWFSLDPPRTSPVGGNDPAESWARYALDAPVMFVSEGGDRLVAQATPLTFAQWIARGHAVGYPDMADVALHLTTLFPPVRPRGWLELRMIDMLPLEWARAAVAVAHTVLTDREVREAVMSRTRTAAVTWRDAYLFGSAHPEIASAANICFEMALSSLEATDATDRTLGAVAEYAERFVRRRRTPADDSLEAWVKGRDPFAPDGREAAWT
nr:glutamate-cysteine ligase family protein [Actinomycetota bacterium]